MSIIFGNPEPMPTEINYDTGSVYNNEIIEISKGCQFDFCVFNNCEFVGIGPVTFNNCDFNYENEVYFSVKHLYFFCCVFKLNGWEEFS